MNATLPRSSMPAARRTALPRARPSKTLRRAFETDLTAILLAEDWPHESLPVSARLDGSPFSRGEETAWRIKITAAGPTKILGDPLCLAIGFFAFSSREHRRRVARRLHRWAEDAWANGIRRMAVEIASPSQFSSHALIEAYARAARWDADPSRSAESGPGAAPRRAS